MKYVAKVEKILHTGIHKLVTQIKKGEFVTKDMPFPNHVEIEVYHDGVMMYRYQNDGTFCGDTWNEDLIHAKAQALYEDGIPEDAWQVK